MRYINSVKIQQLNEFRLITRCKCTKLVNVKWTFPIIHTQTHTQNLIHKKKPSHSQMHFNQFEIGTLLYFELILNEKNVCDFQRDLCTLYMSTCRHLKVCLFTPISLCAWPFYNVFSIHIYLFNLNTHPHISTRKKTQWQTNIK